jgi:aconitate hydratase
MFNYCIFIKTNAIITIMENTDAHRLPPVAQMKCGDKSLSFIDLEAVLGSDVQRLPVVLRLLLENLLRNSSPAQVHETQASVAAIRDWLTTGSSEAEIPYQPSRVLMHDTTSTPALVDIAAMRDALAESGADPRLLNPMLPVDVSVDHSLAVEVFGQSDAKRCKACASIRPARASCTRSIWSNWPRW